MGRKFRLSTHRKNEKRKKKTTQGAAAAMKPLRRTNKREVTAALKASFPL